MALWSRCGGWEHTEVKYKASGNRMEKWKIGKSKNGSAGVKHAHKGLMYLVVIISFE